MDVLTWIVVGFVAGLLASLVMGGIGFGILGDIIIGILGALFGGWLFGRMGWSAPASGIAGTIFVAFIGAVVLLLIIRLLRGARRTP
ncbi:MAG: GlsB/YeaQ/YmgE family stress response membrane protein [Gemmatimonadales bacterium]